MKPSRTLEDWVVSILSLLFLVLALALFVAQALGDQWPTNQPHAPKLSISKGTIEKDVYVTNTSYYWPDGPQGELKWTYIDSERRLTLRVFGTQTNVVIPVGHIQWLIRLNKSTGMWEYFAGSGQTNWYDVPSGIVFSKRTPQPGRSGITKPPTPK